MPAATRGREHHPGVGDTLRRPLYHPGRASSRYLSLPYKVANQQVRYDYRAESLKPQTQPICAGDGSTTKGDKKNQQNEPAAAAGAGATPPETKAILQPIEDPIEKSQFE